MENYLLIAIAVIAIWVASFGLYLYTSRQQRDLQEELDAVKQSLDQRTDD